MSLHPTPSTLALNVGSNGSRSFIWDSIADNGGPGIGLSEALPIDASHHLAAQAGDDHLLVVTDSPDRWAGYQQVSTDSIDEITSRLQPILDRADRFSTAMLVLDVAGETWTAELVEFAQTMLRQGRSYGLYVLLVGIDSIPESVTSVSGPDGLTVSRIPITLASSPNRPFPELIARSKVAGWGWAEQPLTLDLQPA